MSHQLDCDQVYKWEEDRNLTDIGKLSSLRTYPVSKFVVGENQEYLKGKYAKEVCKFRTGQVIYEAKAAKETLCILCNEVSIDATHLLLHCSLTRDLLSVKNAILEFTEGVKDYFYS